MPLDLGLDVHFLDVEVFVQAKGSAVRRGEQIRPEVERVGEAVRRVDAHDSVRYPRLARRTPVAAARLRLAHAAFPAEQENAQRQFVSWSSSPAAVNPWPPLLNQAASGS